MEEREREIAEIVDLLMEDLKDMLAYDNWPPTRKWIRPEAYEVRYIGPRWLVWLIRKFKVAVEVKEPPDPEGCKFDGLAGLVTTDIGEKYGSLYDELRVSDRWGSNDQPELMDVLSWLSLLPVEEAFMNGGGALHLRMSRPLTFWEAFILGRLNPDSPPEGIGEKNTAFVFWWD